MTLVDEVEEHMSGGGLAVLPFELAEADVVDDQESGTTPAFQTTRVGVVCEPGIEVGDQVDAAGVTNATLGLAGAHGDGLYDVALARAGLAGQEKILGPLEKAQAGQVFDQRPVERGLKVPVEGFEGLSRLQAAAVDAALNAALGLLARCVAQYALEKSRPRWLLGLCP